MTMLKFTRVAQILRINSVIPICEIWYNHYNRNGDGFQEMITAVLLSSGNAIQYL